MAEELKGFANLMRYCNTLEDYEQKKADGKVTDDVLVIVLEDKLIKFKGYTFNLSGEGGSFTIDDILSATSTNPVTSRAIKEYVDLHPQYERIDEIEAPEIDLGGEGGDSQIRSIFLDDSEASLAYNRESYQRCINASENEMVLFTFGSGVSDTILQGNEVFHIYMTANNARAKLSLKSDGYVVISNALPIMFVLGDDSELVRLFFESVYDINMLSPLRIYEFGEDGSICEIDSYLHLPLTGEGVVEYSTNNKRFRNTYNVESGELLKHEEITIGGLKYSEERTLYMENLTDEQKAYNVETYNKILAGDSITINYRGTFFDIANIEETFIYITKSVTLLFEGVETSITVVLKLNADGTVESFNSVDSVVVLYVPTVGGTLSETRKQSNKLIASILQIEYISMVTNDDIPFGLKPTPIGFQDTNQVIFFQGEIMCKATIDFSTGDVVTSVMGALTLPTE